VQETLRIVDFFCGCGGFSLGAARAGLIPILAFDIDPILTCSFVANHPKTRLVLSDLATVRGRDVVRALDGPVDGVIGGPPCQAFSEIGHKKHDDPRRSLLGEYFRLVAELKPAFFILENVRGLGYANSRPVLDTALSRLPGYYEILGPIVLDAADFGAATTRPRLFVLGYRSDRMDRIAPDDIEGLKRAPATVRAAISDLSNAVMLEDDGAGFDLWKIVNRGRPSSYAARLRSHDRTFTGHRRTMHSPQVVKRFRRLRPGQVDIVGRHPRLDWQGQCPTLRAGTGKELGSFQSVRPIHPTEPRVITVREAARLQGFPDSFNFHPSIWHSFRMIGNSVSPVAAEALCSLIYDRMGASMRLKSAAE